MNDVLYQVFLLFPTVLIAAVSIRTAIKFGRDRNWIADGDALLWNAGLNAAVYSVLFLAGQFGYATQVETFFTWVNANIDAISAAASLAVLVFSSTGATKLFHELVKKLDGLKVQG